MLDAFTLRGNRPVCLALTLLPVLVAGAAQASTETVLYSFKGGRDGKNPENGLVMVGSTLFGTTPAGGETKGGTLFLLHPDGVEKVIHTFGTGTDGKIPNATLVVKDGLLYGTTTLGGANGLGTVFSITHEGVETVLHSFGGPGDVARPTRMIKVGSAFFGPAVGDYPNTPGGVFEITPDGTERVLQFRSLFDRPISLVNVHGILFGVDGTGGRYAKGSLFKMNLAGETKTLHEFGYARGSYPSGSLLLAGDKIYGVTSQDGLGAGEVYEVDLSAVGTTAFVTRIFSFSTWDTGYSPYGGLIEVGGKFYGTTTGGGAYSNGGTLYALTPPSTPGGSWTEEVVHSFGNGTDGSSPRSELLNVGGTLYGTTYAGGTKGFGTVFSFTP